MAAVKMWTSKLGNKYPSDQIQGQDSYAQKELKRLRSLKECGNHFCADCGSHDNSWASVTHGVFVCIICSDVHRAVGTHITKMKGCTGTYLWGPDELERMQTIGNSKADEIYGGKKISPGASKAQKQEFVVDKYERRVFVGSFVATPTPGGMDVAVCSGAPRERKAIPANVRHTIPVVEGKRFVAHKADIPDSFFDDLFGAVEEPSLLPDLIELEPPKTGKQKESVRDQQQSRPPQDTTWPEKAHLALSPCGHDLFKPVATLKSHRLSGACNNCDLDDFWSMF